MDAAASASLTDGGPAVVIVGLVAVASTLAALILALRYLRPPPTSLPTSLSLTSIPTLPPTSPDLGNLSDFATCGSFHHFLVHLHQQLGDVAAFHWGRTLVVSLTPAHFRATLHLRDRPALLFSLFLPLIGPASLQYADAAEWKRRRQAYISPAFGHPAIVHYSPTFTHLARVSLTAWAAHRVAPFTLPLQAHMLALSFQAICVTAFGKARSPEYVAAFKEGYELVWHCLEGQIDGTGTGQVGAEELDAAVERIKRAVLALVDERRQELKVGAATSERLFIDELLQSDASSELVYSDALTFLVGGFHTTGNWLTWLFYFLARHPHVQSRVREELTAVCGADDELTYAQVPRLPYLRQVMDETLRLSALAPFAARVSPTPLQLSNGLTIPADTPIVQPLGLASHDPQLWSDPQRFDPERFAKGSEQPRGGNRLAFSPFGLSGGRVCPGQAFAYSECALVTAVYLREFEVGWPEGAPEVESRFGLVAYPKHEIYVTMTRLR